MERILSSTLSNEKLLVQWLIPGIIALTPYFFMVVFSIYDLKVYLSSQMLLATTIFIILSICIGLVLDIVGTYVEHYSFDKRLQVMVDESNFNKDCLPKLYPNFYKDWNGYLLSNFKKDEEPIIIRYIRATLFRMKFEVSMGLALIVFVTGSTLYYNMFHIDISIWKVTIFLVICLSIGIVLVFHEGFNSARILANSRQLLANRFEEKEETAIMTYDINLNVRFNQNQDEEILED
ncbi:MAG: hypothetical protein ACK4WD_01080 [Flavobacteriales bacterium]|jgi:hypothetical protein